MSIFIECGKSGSQMLGTGSLRLPPYRTLLIWTMRAQQGGLALRSTLSIYAA
jgi:hypothetical protein